MSNRQELFDNSPTKTVVVTISNGEKHAFLDVDYYLVEGDWVKIYIIGDDDLEIALASFFRPMSVIYKTHCKLEDIYET